MLLITKISKWKKISLHGIEKAEHNLSMKYQDENNSAWF